MMTMPERVPAGNRQPALLRRRIRQPRTLRP